MNLKESYIFENYFLLMIHTGFKEMLFIQAELMDKLDTKWMHVKMSILSSTQKLAICIRCFIYIFPKKINSTKHINECTCGYI